MSYLFFETKPVAFKDVPTTERFILEDGWGKPINVICKRLSDTEAEKTYRKDGELVVEKLTFKPEDEVHLVTRLMVPEE